VEALQLRDPRLWIDSREAPRPPPMSVECLTARDGKPYVNTYAWFLEVRDGRIVVAHAFFDSIAFDELWTRVAPAGGTDRAFDNLMESGNTPFECRIQLVRGCSRAPSTS
jgi:hypothetical protein